MKNNIDRRDFMRVLGMGAASLAVSPWACQSPAPRDTPPNIVILFADDLGYGDLSCYGHPNIQTRHLDRMAAEGIRLTSFYVSSPACSPSRASLLTGRYAIRCGLPHVLGPESQNGLAGSEITLATALKEKGYRTKAVGKWHLGHAEKEFMPTSHGFDSYFGLLYSNDMIKPWVQTDKPLELYRDLDPIEHPVDQTTLTLRYTQEAVKFIEENKDFPFFLYLPYSMVHLPIHTAPQFKGKSRGGLYGDVVEAIDWSAGQILDTLNKLGLDERTIVIFTSDNGPWLNLPDRMLQEGNERWHAGSSGLLRGYKHTTYEGGPRVPGIVRWPGHIPAGQVSPEMATTMDLFPTLLNAAGLSVPDDRAIDGRDILPLLQGKGPAPVRDFYYFRSDVLQGVREGAWKLRYTRHLRPELDNDQPITPELFNLDLDPSEQYNRAGEYPEIVARLMKKFRDFGREVNAKMAE